MTVSGGRGGHSGGDIDAGRSNAIKLLARALSAAPGLRIVTLDGGASRNAIPRDAAATVLAGSDDVDRIVAAGDEAAAAYERTDPGVRVAVERAGGGGAAGRRVDRGGERAHPRPRRRPPARSARHERGLPRRRRDEQSLSVAATDGRPARRSRA